MNYTNASFKSCRGYSGTASQTVFVAIPTETPGSSVNCQTSGLPWVWRMSWAVSLTFFSSPLAAHHGVASLGAAGVMGPGAPVEASTSATLPVGKSLAYFKMDRAEWQHYTTARDDEQDASNFFLAGGGYGFTPWFSAYAFLPFNVKKVQDNSFNTAGFADLSVMAVFGARFDNGFQPIGETESLDDLEDWHFTVYTGMSLPTGQANTRDSSAGAIDPGRSTGFGSPSYSLGLTGTKMYGRFTWINDLSLISFDPHEYADGVRTRFGSEFRYNLAFTYRAHINEAAKFRVDPVLELNFVSIAADRSMGVSHRTELEQYAAANGIAIPAAGASVNDSTPPWRVNQAIAGTSTAVPSLDPWGTAAQWKGTQLEASGGRILYGLLGLRLYKENVSFAGGVKMVAATDMNRIPLSRTMGFAYLQGSAAGDAVGAVADAWWTNVVHEKRLLQGSEGRELYRLVLSVSALL